PGRCICLLFFFSSRRRHTSFSRDWSSDVCSSDLACETEQWLAGECRNYGGDECSREQLAFNGDVDDTDAFRDHPTEGSEDKRSEIGRAPCRESGWRLGGARDW